MRPLLLFVVAKFLTAGDIAIPGNLFAFLELHFYNFLLDAQPTDIKAQKRLEANEIICLVNFLDLVASFSSVEKSSQYQFPSGSPRGRSYRYKERKRRCMPIRLKKD